MNLFIETFFNNFMFEEIFAMLKSIDISPLDSLIYLKNHSELHGKKFITTINDFIKETNNLFDTWEEANSYMKSDGVIDKYNKGEIGNNELLFYSAQLFNEFEEICNLIFKSVEESLKGKSLITKEIQNYLSELKRFMFMMKKDLLVDIESVKSANFNYDFQKIQKAEYKINPNSISISKNPIKFDFFHDKNQQELISNQLKLYSGHAWGIGRMLQQTNLKRIFRNFNLSTN